MFGLSKENEFVPREPSFMVLDDNAPVLIQGIQEYDTLCPVNPLTGHRDSILKCLTMALSDANKGLVDNLLLELPTIKQMDCSDEVKIDTLVSSLDVLAPADRDLVADALMKISEPLLHSGKKIEPIVDNGSIDFNKGDNPSPDANI